MKNMGERIRELRLAKGLTQEELGRLVGVQRSAVNKWEKGHVTNLKRDVIEKLSSFFGVTPSYLMGMTDVSAETAKTRRVPVVGSVAAGAPILVLEEWQDYVELDDKVSADFAVRVKGDSMVDARIYDGDIVFVRRQPTVENGEIAVVLLDDEVVIKRFFRTPQGIILQSENAEYAPLYIPADEADRVRILGKAVMVQSLIR